MSVRVLRLSSQLLLYRCCSAMNTTKSKELEALEEFFSPPASVRGSTVLNREDFRRNVTLPAIRLRDAVLCSPFMQRLPHALLRFPTIKRVVSDAKEDGQVEKVILLMPDGLLGNSRLSEGDCGWIRSNGGEVSTHTVALDYSHFSIFATLRALLPLELREVPTGFETVGHIAHFNLRNEYLPFKKIIGQVILDKQPNIRTVVNKTNQIDDTFRFFKMEVLAGENDLMATVKENGCTFSFDFSKVYWNSRLHTEHERLVKQFKSNDVVVDVFAGVGPFAVPAAKKGCTVYANDLNPHSYKYLCSNSTKNGVSKKLKAYNLDGREFIRQIFIQDLLHPLDNFDESVLSSKSKRASHIVMNLPAIAVEFLNTFRGLFSSIPAHHRDSIVFPKVHCYCFSKSENSPEDDALEMVKRNLGVASLPEGTYSIYNVRRVAPNKVMMRVSFRIPGEVAFSTTTECCEHAVEGGVKCPEPGTEVDGHTSTSAGQEKRAVGRSSGSKEESLSGDGSVGFDAPSSKRRKTE